MACGWELAEVKREEGKQTINARSPDLMSPVRCFFFSFRGFYDGSRRSFRSGAAVRGGVSLITGNLCSVSQSWEKRRDIIGGHPESELPDSSHERTKLPS